MITLPSGTALYMSGERTTLGGEPVGQPGLSTSGGE